jgi:hypothetical protein
MKKTYLIILLLVGLSCNETDVFKEDFERGGLIVFAPKPESTRISLLEIESYTFTTGIEDPNNNATLYALDLTYGNIVVENFITITTFPNTLTFTAQDILTALNLTANEIDLTLQLEFLATVTTPNGIFNGALSDFNFQTNEQEGGESGNLLFDNPAFNQALAFNFTFFLPPPKKLRGTSFESSFGTGLGSDYTRPSADASLTAALLNNPGERHVQYVAVGTGVDDEIGFTTNFVDNGGSGFDSEEVGVTTSIDEVGEFLDGTQGYQLEDIDGILIVEFDRVEVDANLNPSSGIQIQFFPLDTGYESEDNITIKAIVERGNASETIELTNISNGDIEAVAGRWNLANTGFLTGVTAYTLIIEAAIDSGNEDVYFDQMLVYITD